MRLVGRFGRKVKVGDDYRPLEIEHGMYCQFGVGGRDLVAASENYHNATNQWMFGLGVFRNIRLDATHLVRLVNFDCGTVMDRTRDGGRNFVYRISTQLYLGEGLDMMCSSPREVVEEAPRMVPVYTNAQLGSAIASDFDVWWRKAEEMRKK